LAETDADNAQEYSSPVIVCDIGKATWLVELKRPSKVKNGDKDFDLPPKKWIGK